MNVVLNVIFSFQHNLVPLKIGLPTILSRNCYTFIIIIMNMPRKIVCVKILYHSVLFRFTYKIPMLTIIHAKKKKNDFECFKMY